jgi:hypothetical protein
MELNREERFLFLENVENEEDRYIHLTNAAVQKKHPDFKKEKENTIWSIEKFHVKKKNVFLFHILTFKQLKTEKK